MQNRILAIGVCAFLVSCGSGGNDVVERKNTSPDKTTRAMPATPQTISSDTVSVLCEIDFTSEKLPVACEQAGTYQAVFINGSKSGHAISGRLELADRVESCEFSRIVLKRGEISMTAISVTNTVETRDGKPLAWQAISEGGGMKKESCGVVDGNMARIRTIHAGNDTLKEIPWDGEALMQEGIRRFVKSKPLTAGTTLKARGFDVDSESVVTLDYTVKGRENVDLLGKITPSIHVETTVTQSGSSIQTSEWLNDELETLKSASNVMGMHIETIACEREYALQQNSPAEIFTASFIKSPRPLNKRMLSNGVAYLISPTEEKKLIFPKSKEQKVDSVENSSDISIQVKPLAMPSGAKMPYDGSDAEILRFLNSNAWIQSENKAIVALANQAVGSETAPDKAASKIEKFVSSYISNRSLSVGYASALEVLHSKQGDCTEFALLTAALCRAVGIPARVVFGVVYVASEFEGHRHFFGGHAWTQVYIADGWYSLDAAMGKFDAGHIAIDTNDGEPSNFFRLISTMGYFDISRVSALK